VSALTYGPANINMDLKGWQPLQNIFSKSYLNN
jgi:hypothetical protein